MELQQIREWLEILWLGAKDRGDNRGQILALLALVELHLVDSWKDMGATLYELKELYPLKEEPWRWGERQEGPAPVEGSGDEPA